VIRHKKKFTTPALLAVAAVILIISMIPHVTMTMASSEFDDMLVGDIRCKNNFPNEMYKLFCFSAIMCNFIAAMCWELRKCKENYSLVKEFMAIFSGIAVLATFAIVRFIPQYCDVLCSQGWFPLEGFYGEFIPCVISLSGGLYFVIWKSYQNQRGVSSTGNTNTSVHSENPSQPPKVVDDKTLHMAILRDPLGLSLYEAFLVSEFAVENIAFWKAVQRLKDFCNSRRGSREDILRMSDSICKEFVLDQAEFQINIASHNRRQTLAKLKDVQRRSVGSAADTLEAGRMTTTTGPSNAGATTPEEMVLQLRTAEMLVDVLPDGEFEAAVLGVFKDAEAEIIRLIQMDNFKRFKLTEKFREYMQDHSPL